MTEFTKQVSTTEFLVCTELLPAARERYGSTFSLLEIPEVFSSDPSGCIVHFRDYDGQKYNGHWSEHPGQHQGGRTLGTELSSEMVQLLKDLEQIDVNWLLALHPVGKTLERSAFDLPGWLSSIKKEESLAISMGISLDELRSAEELVSRGFHFTRRIVSNGDFYPRNLIKMPGRLVLVDWAFSEGNRICYIDYLVNVAAFAFIHMWNNRPWQDEFVRELLKTFDVTLDDFRRGVLIKSFEQAKFWQQCAPPLVSTSVSQFKMAVRNEILG